MTYVSATYTWVIIEDELSYGFALAKIAKALSCILSPTRQQSPEGLEVCIFTVYALTEEILNGYVEAAKTQMPFTDWAINLEEVEPPVPSGMEAWDWVIAHAFIDTMLTLTEYNRQRIAELNSNSP